MSFTDTFIKRPVFASVLSLLLLLVGLMSYLKLPLRDMPEVPTPVINISISYAGASAELMEGFVTSPIESALAGVTGLDYITSNTTAGNSSIQLFLKIGTDANIAAAEVNAKISSISYKLPKGANNPVVAKQDPNANPIIYLSFVSKTMSAEALTDYLIRVVKPQLEAVDGVASAQLLGEREYAMRVWLNPLRMAAYSVTPADVSDALKNNNLQAPTGRLDSKFQAKNIAAETDINSAQQFNNLVVKTVNNRVVRLERVGKAELGAKSSDFSVNVKGIPAVFFGITAKSDANPLDVAQRTDAIIHQLQETLPKGITSEVIKDDSKFIAASIHEVKRTIIEACIFVIIVIFLFLGSLRTLLIPTVAIPLSLMGACAFMLALGFTLNTMTFLAMVLAIGLVVDDAIVVVENIHRHIEMGKNPIAAALIGAREIKFAVIAMTITLAAVYAPIGFIGGMTGALFKEFAFTLAGAVIISGFVALTLSPMLCSKMMRTATTESKLEHLANYYSEKLMFSYRDTLIRVLEKRPFVLGIILVVFACCYGLFQWIPHELAPKEDTGVILIVGKGPASANLQFTEKYASQIPPLFTSLPEYETYGVVNGWQGLNSSVVFILLKPWEERKRNATEIAFGLFPGLSQITGLQAFAFNPFQLPGETGGFDPLQLVLKTTGSYEQLNKVAQSILEKARKNTGLTNLNVDIKIDKPQTTIKINRDKAGTLGVTMSEISSALVNDFAQPAVSQFNMNGRAYDVIPQLDPRFREQPKAINNVYVRSASNDLVPLSNMVSLDTKVVPRELNHFQQMRSATITASLIPPYSLGEAIPFMKKITLESMPVGMQYDYTGQSRQFMEASGAMTAAMSFAILFIFLVLAAQFESFRDPLIVLFTVPLSTFGALLAIKIAPGASLNIYTDIALVTLVGLISKHGILMVEFANHLQLEGKSAMESIVEAASLRLRPILMTTAAMVLGVIPLALSSGAGALSRSQLGWAIVGGLTIGTFFTLFVIHTVYSYLATQKKLFTSGDPELDKTIL
jgi:hydrophobe/amphiphile efflux-1 (HAE1) family protein